MAGTVKHARLESQSARVRLKRGRQAHWQALQEGKVHLGYQCWKGEPVGRWLLRRYIGHNKDRVQTLGRADDAVPPPPGIAGLSFFGNSATIASVVIIQPLFNRRGCSGVLRTGCGAVGKRTGIERR
jgi:hypothetical protein